MSMIRWLVGGQIMVSFLGMSFGIPNASSGWDDREKSGGMLRTDLRTI